MTEQPTAAREVRQDDGERDVALDSPAPSAVARDRRNLLVAFHEEHLNGATIAVLRLIEPLQDRGWSLSFWVPQPGPTAEWLRERGHRVGGRSRPIASGLAALRQPPGVLRRSLGTPHYLGEFARFARRCSPDVLHANSLYSFAEALTGKALGIPTVLHLHDMAPSSWKAEPVRRMARHMVDLSVAVSDACARSYRTAGWIPEVVHGAAPSPGSRCEIREHPDPFVVGTVGVVSRRKGSDLFVEAAERMSASHPGIEFRMVGRPSDPLDQEWAHAVLRRARSAGVRHTERGDVAREMAGWDAFVLPSRRDPFPLVVLEAMAAGLPVIGARVDGITEQLGSGAGILVPAGDSAMLAKAIERLAAASHEQRARLAQAARERVLSRFNIDRQASGMDRMYRRVLLAPE